MKSSTLQVLAAVMAGMAMAAAPDPASVRQRYRLDPAKARDNAARVSRDLAQSAAPKSPVAIYTVPAMSAVKRLADTYPDDGALFAPLSWIASRNEFEPASFVMYAGADEDAVTVQASDLVGKAGKIPASAIDFKVVKLWYQGGSAWYGYFADATQRTLVPELLLHDENLVYTDDATKDYYVRYENEDGGRRYAWLSSRFEVTDYRFDNQANQGLIKDADTLQPFVLNKGEFKQVLATLHVPAGQAPGVYKGRLALKNKGGAEIASLDMRVRVLPLDLPDPMTSYNPDKGFYLCLYGTGTRNPKIMKDLAEHNCKTPMGFPSIDPMNPAGLDRDIRLAKEYGLLTRPVLFGVAGVGKAVWSNPPSPGDLAELDKLRDTISKTRALSLEKLGHTDFFSYGIDEGGPGTIRAERDAWRIAHEAGGKVGVSTFAHRELLFALDLMIMPGMPVERREKEVKLFHDSNPDALCGWYANPHCGPESPDYFRRIHGLSAWQAGYDVSLNYCWWRNNWNDMAVPYEPNLRAIVSAYGAADSVIDTLAWDAIREGLDDIRYATLCKQLALKAAKSDVGDIMLKGRRVLSFLAYWDGYRADPAAFRAECINHILALDSLLKGGK